MDSAIKTPHERGPDRLVRVDERLYPMTTAGMVPPGFRIGGIILRDGYGGADMVHMETEGGEGGDFSAAELEQVLRAFYDANF